MKKITIFLLVCLSILYLFVKDYRELFDSKKVIISNLSDLSTGSCYTSFTITNGTDNQIVVGSNSSIYYCFKNNKEVFNLYHYVYKIGKSIENGESVMVNDSTYKHLKCFFLDSQLLPKYKKEVIVNDTLFVYSNNRIKEDKFNWDEEKALVYILLHRNIQSCSNCEAGNIEAINILP